MKCRLYQNFTIKTDDLCVITYIDMDIGQKMSKVFVIFRNAKYILLLPCRLDKNFKLFDIKKKFSNF